MTVTRRQALAGLTASLALTSCQVAPGTGKSGFNLLNEDDERKLGRDTHPQIVKEFGGIHDDPALGAYVAGIGHRLVKVCETPAAQFRFTVLNSPIVNAMALPGGYIYVTRGLLALTGNEAEIAGVVGHEIGHVLARHTAERVSQAQATNVLSGVLGVIGAVAGIPGVGDVAQMGAGAYLQSFSRDQETEADHLGLRYLSRAGWHPHAMVSMLERLRDQARLEALMAGRSPDSVDKMDFMASHPRTIDRVHAAMTEAAGAAPQGALGMDPFLDRVDGLVYGDDVSQGVVRDRVFLHPGLDLRFEVPDGFRLVNGEKAVVASHASGAGIVFDGAPARGVADMASYVSRVWLPRSKLEGLNSLDVNGMPAATAVTTGRNRQGNVQVRVVAIRTDVDHIHRFTFVMPPNQMAAMSTELKRTTYSLRRLSADDRAGIHPWRLRIHRVQPGDTVESLANRMAPGQWKVELFQVLNGLQPGEKLEQGRRVKVVRG
ncbi:MAG: M48 family metalloprotease [Rhodospirillaceae bacterium]|nr:M48 family metalloprotease [Rhodospirillales bacterium]